MLRLSGERRKGEADRETASSIRRMGTSVEQRAPVGIRGRSRPRGVQDSVPGRASYQNAAAYSRDEANNHEGKCKQREALSPHAFASKQWSLRNRRGCRVRTLVETGVLAGERGRYELTRTIETVRVPASVQAILAARIDRLESEDRQLLQTAAVVGMDVPFRLLHAVVEWPEERFRSGLARLQAAEFLYEASLFPELQYTFKHALTHEVAYGSLLGERRRDLHARIVQAMERLAPARLEEEVERLAHHALRGEVWDKAVGYLDRAGRKAAMHSAHREAVRPY